jgi:hypothetical protein
MNENRIVILDRGVKEMAGPESVCCYLAFIPFRS